jgi:hypothetical protein
MTAPDAEQRSNPAAVLATAPPRKTGAAPACPALWVALRPPIGGPNPPLACTDSLAATGCRYARGRYSGLALRWLHQAGAGRESGDGREWPGTGVRHRLRLWPDRLGIFELNGWRLGRRDSGRRLAPLNFPSHQAPDPGADGYAVLAGEALYDAMTSGENLTGIMPLFIGRSRRCPGPAIARCSGPCRTRVPALRSCRHLVSCLYCLSSRKGAG